MNNSLKVLSVVTTIIMAMVLLQGALVTNTGSGRGCGDTWPLCEGQALPAANINSLIEYSHRAVSGIAGILVVTMAFWAWHALNKRLEAALLAAMSVGFIVIQALLGAAAVVWPQPKTVLALHFGISLVSFASVFLLAVMVFREGKNRAAPPLPSQRFQRWALGIFAYTYVVVYLGAFVRHTGASLACTGWPLCNGQVVPELTGQVGAHFIHRVAAGVLVLLMAYFAYIARQERQDLARTALLSCALVVLQALSGALVVLGGLSLSSQTLHGGLMIVLFGAVSYLLWQSLPLHRDPAPAFER